MAPVILGQRALVLGQQDHGVSLVHAFLPLFCGAHPCFPSAQNLHCLESGIDILYNLIIFKTPHLPADQKRSERCEKAVWQIGLRHRTRAAVHLRVVYRTCACGGISGQGTVRRILLPVD